MTVIDGLQFTQFNNLNVLGQIYEHGVPFGGVNAPLTLSTADDDAVSPLSLVGGASTGVGNFDYINSGLTFTDTDTIETWRLWAGDPNHGGGNGANLYLGYRAGFDQPTDSENIAAASWNTGMGWSVLESCIEASRSTAVGMSALRTVVDGMDNSAFGAQALENTTGENSTAVGSQALMTNTTADNNTAMGYRAACLGETGEDNTAVGATALELATSEQNTAIGSGALKAATTGAGNIALGYNAGSNTSTGEGNILIGNSVQAPTAATDDWLNIGGLIEADLATKSVIINNMPTSDPGVLDVLWSDSGDVKISLGP